MPATYSYDAGTDSYFVTGGCGDATITIPDTYNDGTNGTKNVTRINANAFLNCTSLISITLGNNIARIYSQAFKGCSSLSSVTFPTSSLTRIDSSAFWGTALINVVIPNSVTTLGDSIFVNCYNLASLTLPTNGTITTVPQGLCVSCTSLTSITIPSNYTHIQQDAFIFSELETVILNEGLIDIGIQAFFSCPLAGTLTIPNSVTVLRERAFEQTGPDVYSSTNRFDIIIGTGLVNILSHCFWASEVTSITFRSPSSLDLIGPGAFAGCASLENLYLPDSVTKIIAQSMDPINCGVYDDPPFYQLFQFPVSWDKVLRIGNNFAYPPVYIQSANLVGGTCVPNYASGSLSALAPILSGIRGNNIIFGKNVTGLDSTSFPPFEFNRGYFMTFEGKMSSIGNGTFATQGYAGGVIGSSGNLIFNDFADTFILGDSAFNFLDKITILPKPTVRIN